MKGVKNLDSQLREAGTFDEVFKLVKRVVERRLGLHRAGLGLILADLPPHIAAYTAIGSNAIVLNKLILNALASLVRERIELNSYVFVVLLHEYLHTFGLDEQQTRQQVKHLVQLELGEEHIASKIASTSLFELYPELKAIQPIPTEREAIIVKDFDSDSVSYIK